MSQGSGNPEDTITLVLEGNLTIVRASDAKVELQEALKNAQHIELDIESAREVDLAFLQLLCSAHRTSINMDKTLVFQSAIPEIFKKSVEDNGYARHTGCALDCNNTCLWMMK